MKDKYNIKGITVCKVNYHHDCNYEGCKRSAYYKFVGANAVGKAFREASKVKKTRSVQTGVSKAAYGKVKPVYKDETYIQVPYGTGYFCSFDCARKHLLYKTFEARVKLTPLVKDFLGQGPIPITDHEVIIENQSDIHIPGNPSYQNDQKDCYIKISPNGLDQYPFLLDFSNHGFDYPIGFTLEGAKKLIQGLQTLITEQDTWQAEKKHMMRRKKLDKP